jgi:hypothetical protein
MFAREMSAARTAYARFIQAGIGAMTNNELVLGNPNDPRILGSDRFIEALPVKLPRRCVLTIDQISERVCRSHGIDSAQLRSSSRDRQLSLVRSLVVHSALNLRVASLSELAGHFCRSASALHQSIQHYRHTHPELFTSSAVLDRE